MNKAPAFQFYPKDFLSDEKVVVMDMEARGVYITLICYDWNETGISNDQAILKELCKNPENWEAIWKKVGKCFYEKNGRLYNPRLEVERKKQKKWRKKSSEGGKKSAETRRRKALLKGGSEKIKNDSKKIEKDHKKNTKNKKILTEETITSEMPEEKPPKGGSRVVVPKGNSSSSSSSSSSTTKNKKKKIYKKRKTFTEEQLQTFKSEFEILWKYWPKEGRFLHDYCLMKFMALCKKGLLADFKKITNGYFQFLEDKRINENFAQKVMHLKTWLNNWEKERAQYENFKFEPRL